MIRSIATLSAVLTIASPLVAAPEPKPYGAVPSPRQLAWQEMETYAFIHFGLNAWTNREWGYGDEDPAKFNPTDFDADRIVAALKAGGMMGVILTAKHHDGFCLWPTKTTPHNISKSPFRGGKGDLVREIGEACRKAGLKFGIYVSPWDRNNPEYARAGYVDVYHGQIRELLTNYGPLFEVWFDGANGGDGWYGGTKEKRKIDSRTYYQWEKIIAMIRQYQPAATIFGTPAGDIRWVGNESGYAPEVCRPIIAEKNNFHVERHDSLMGGDAEGESWLPAECDVSIRPGWFWHKAEDTRVKTPRQLFDLYFRSVGHGASFLLNVPPNTDGRIADADVKALAGFDALLKATFATDLAAGAKAEASAVRGGDSGFGPEKLLDGDRNSYWTTDDGVTDASVTLTLPEARTFDVVSLREATALGLRIENWAVDVFENGDWKEYAKGTVIGNRRLIRGRAVTTTRIRVRLSGGKVAPCLSEIALFARPVTLVAPTISRTRDGLVTLSGVEGAKIRYTTDGSEPPADGTEYVAPFLFAKSGVVKARAFAPKGGSGDIATATYGIPKARWKILSASAGADKAGAAIDDNPRTFWYTHEQSGRKAPPQSIAVDMGETVAIGAFLVSPRADGVDHGLVDRYRFEISDDGKSWKPVAEGEFSNIRANPVEQTVKLPSPVKARYFRFTGLRCVAGDQVAIGELGVSSIP